MAIRRTSGPLSLSWLSLATAMILLVAACGAEAEPDPDPEEPPATEAPAPEEGPEETEPEETEPEEPEEVITLRLANGLAAGNQATLNWVIPFIEKAEELGAGGLQIEHFPDSQLGGWEDAVTIVQTGVTDLAVVAAPYVTGQMPLSNALNLPGLGSFQTLTEAYYDLMMDEGSVIREVDFDRNDLVPLAAGATPPYELVTVDRPIGGPDALAGLLVRSGGGALDLVVRSLGGEPVAITSGEQYQALERGTVDAGIFNYPALLSASLHEVTAHGTLNASVGGFNFAMAIARSVWDDLPGWAQEALLEAGRYATENRVAALLDEEQEILDELRSGGFTFYEFDEAQLAQLAEMLEPVAADWVGTVSAEGFPAEQALDEARAASERHS